ncbi:MAG: 2-succinyl-6-hydroxy-2,4-cyclohexadiene-1-carboxylate synthase [Caldithrix sp. RBG_13_44_9]|nr:MAG: 2-succinyl-6-hydroxy-2,4-cyclohexadiene-1-carboxylate synthase [Caldithrix sp. RBG_13_44_9]
MSDLHYQLDGSPGKPLLVFLHGFLGSVDDWNFAVDHFVSDYCCLRIDLPGHGQTRLADPAQYAMPSTARLLIELLDKLKMSQAHLLGYSMGGRLALYLGVHYPDRFLKIILESASPGLEDSREQKQRQEQDERLAQALEKKELEQFLREWYNLPLFQNLSLHPSFREMFQRRLQNDPLDLARSLRQMGTGSQPSLWSRLSEVQLPVLLLAGEKDQKFRDLAIQMQERNSQFRISVVESCGHTIHFENEKRFLQEAAEFLMV